MGQSFHTQQERLLPTPSSRPVTMTKPTTNAIPPATTLPSRMERRRVGGTEANLENGSLNLIRALCNGCFFGKSPGIFVTAPGTRPK